MGRRAAKKAEKKASRAQERELEEANAASAAAEEAQKKENKRIFDATKPMEQSAGVQFGLQDRENMASYSDFEGGAAATEIGQDLGDNTPNFNATGGGLVTPKAPEPKKAPEIDYGGNPWFKLMFKYRDGNTFKGFDFSGDKRRGHPFMGGFGIRD